MAPSLTFKDIALESSLFRSRGAAAFLLVIVMLAAIVVRLVQLQLIEFDHFTTLSRENSFKVVPVPPTRGLIFDRNGVILAQNTPTYALEIVPEAVADLESTLKGLKLLVDIQETDEKRFRAQIRKKSPFESVPLKLRLSEEEVARFAVNRHEFPGAEIRARLAREYPMGPLGVHAVGYVGRINEKELQRIDAGKYRGTTYIGKTGVEQSYEDVLHGEVGYEHVEVNAQGRTLRVLERKPPVPGRNIYLSLDASLQAASEAALAGEMGSIVAIEPSTGAVLAFVSVPRFDPNLFVDGIAAARYRELTSSPGRPLFNRAAQGQYPPGSTIKPYLALAGLQGDLVGGRMKSVWCGGFYQLNGKEHRYRDWKKGGHGHVDVDKAIIESCDVYFYQLAYALGIDRMHEFLSQFTFGRKTGIDLQGESPGLLPSSGWKRRVHNQPWYPGETLITGIGQGFTLATPLQLASAAATLGMRGLRVTPHLVERLEDRRTGEVSFVPASAAESIRLGYSSHWNRVTDAMVGVVHGDRGTARKVGESAAYQIAGKTGTAQVFGLRQDQKYEEDEIVKTLRDHALFVSFAPARNPRIAVAVVVENGGSGSRTAAPIARKIMDHYLLESIRPGRRDGLLRTAATVSSDPARISHQNGSGSR